MFPDRRPTPFEPHEVGPRLPLEGDQGLNLRHPNADSITPQAEMPEETTRRWQGVQSLINSSGFEGNESGEYPGEPSAADDQGRAGEDTPSQTDVSPVQRLIGSAVSLTTLSERHPDWPPVKLHFHFGPHGTAENLSALPELLSSADVYCYEDNIGEASTRETLAEVSATDLERYPGGQDGIVSDIRSGGESIMGSPMEVQARTIAGTGIAIGHFDVRVSEGDPDLDEHYEQVFRDWSSLGATFDDTLARIESAAARLAGYDRLRDEIMMGPSEGQQSTGQAGRFEREMEQVFEEHPRLLNKAEGEPVVVVDTHGAAHTSLYHRARAAGVDVTRSFSEVPFVYKPTQQLARTLAIGREPSRMLLVQCFVDEALRTVLDYAAPLQGAWDDPGIVRYIRQRSAFFNESEAQRLFDVMSVDSRALPSRTISFLDEILTEKGFGPLPWTKDEIYAAIAEDAERQAQKKAQVLENDARRKAGGDA